jgi:NAD-dependent SIR2 family protein deacetylase
MRKATNMEILESNESNADFQAYHIVKCHCLHTFEVYGDIETAKCDQCGCTISFDTPDEYLEKMIVESMPKPPSEYKFFKTTIEDGRDLAIGMHLSLQEYILSSLVSVPIIKLKAVTYSEIEKKEFVELTAKFHKKNSDDTRSTFIDLLTSIIKGP